MPDVFGGSPNYFNDGDYLIELAKGHVDDAELVTKFGRNTDLPNGSYEPVVESGVLNFLTTADEIRVAAGNAADAAAGAGAREVTVYGLDANGDEASAVLVPNGISAGTASTTQFIRVHRAVVTEVGTYGGANTGAVVIETEGGTALLTIAAGLGQSQQAVYTVPRGKNAILVGGNVSANGNSIDLQLFVREGILDTATNIKAKRLVRERYAIAAGSVNREVTWAHIPELTDIWAEAEGAGGVAGIVVEMDLVVYTPA